LHLLFKVLSSGPDMKEWITIVLYIDTPWSHRCDYDIYTIQEHCSVWNELITTQEFFSCDVIKLMSSGPDMKHKRLCFQQMFSFNRK
jgi:cupin superfamily acireductone dioxygenase involved in methionine salvage